MVVAVAFVTIAIGFNAPSTFSVLFPVILTEFGWDRGVIAAAFSVGFIAATIYSPHLGIAMQRLGPLYLMPLGAVLTSAGLMLTTLATEIWHVYATLGVLAVGVSNVLGYIGHYMFLPNWFEKRRGLAIGLAVSGVGAGSIILLPWFQQMIIEDGWRSACWHYAVLILVVLVPLNYLFQRRAPEDLGLSCDGIRDGISDDSGAASNGSPGSAARNNASTIGTWTLRLAIQTSQFWLIAAAYASAMYAWYTVLVHQTTILIDAGISAVQAAYALGFVGLFGVVGQIALGHLSDCIGREWVWTIRCLGFVICYALLLFIERQPSLLLVYLMVATQGALGYALAPVYSSVTAEVFPGPSYGVIFSTLTIAGNTGAAAGPWLVGALFDAIGSYQTAFLLAIGVAITSSGCIWLVAPSRGPDTTIAAIK